MRLTYDHKISDLKYKILGLLPKESCQKLISIFDKYPELTGGETSYKYSGGEEGQQADNFSCLNLSRITNPNEDILTGLTIARQYISIMTANYVAHIRAKGISPTFNDHLINASTSVRILKYEVGQYIKDHADVDYQIRGSCTLNLNEDYEGGSLTFFNGQIKENLKTGDAIIFPAEPIWIHGTEPVTKGARYAINCFLHNVTHFK